MRPRRLLLLLALALVACADRSSGTPTTGEAPGTPSATAISSGAGETPSQAITPVATEHALTQARRRFVTDPPTFHGVYELREENEPQPLQWELWIRWPSFRVETTFSGEPVVITTEDGKRFGIRQGDQIGTSEGLGEQAAMVLSPVFAQFTGFSASPCESERILGVEEIVGRSAIHVACPEEGSETWVDSESGLVLASFKSDTGPGGDATTGYTSIEFDPRLDHALFEASSL
jgi:hypothetical protein